METMISKILENYNGRNNKLASIITIGPNMYVEMYDNEILVDMVDIPSKSGIEYARSIAENYCNGYLPARNKFW